VVGDSTNNRLGREVIRKRGSKYVVLAESKTASGKRKKLGEYGSRGAAEKRLKQVEYFKHKK
jgi:hypothetical protein